MKGKADAAQKRAIVSLPATDASTKAANTANHLFLLSPFFACLLPSKLSGIPNASLCDSCAEDGDAPQIIFDISTDAN
jgi:hypothetical protein